VPATSRNLIVVIAYMHYQKKNKIYVEISSVQISTINVDHAVA